MEFTLAGHLKKSFEMGKKAMPVYFKLLLILLKYALIFFAFITLSTYFLSFFAALQPLMFIVVIFGVFGMIYLIVKNVQFKVALIKALEPIGKGRVEAGKVWKDSEGNFFKQIFLGICYVLFVAVGLVLLVVPGIIVLVSGSFCMFAAFLRNKGIIESLKYSRRVAKGYFWMIVVRALVAGVLISILFLPTNIFQTKFQDTINRNLSSIQQDVDGVQVIDESKESRSFSVTVDGKSMQLTGEQMKELLGGMWFVLVIYMFYSFAIGFLMLSFGYPYWYLLFLELEKINKVK